MKTPKTPKTPFTHAGAVAHVVETLESYGVEVSPAWRAGIARAFASRGRGAGRLKQKAPAYAADPYGYAAWHAIQPNPRKRSVVSAFAMRILHPDFPAAQLYSLLLSVDWPAEWDQDLARIRALGVR